MKLGKLLAAGKSIMNGHTDVSYRSSKQIYLPKFGSPKNPFKDESPAQRESSAPASGPSRESRPGPTRLAGESGGMFRGESQLSASPEIGAPREDQGQCQEQPRKPSVALGSESQPQAPRNETTNSVQGRSKPSQFAPRLAASKEQKKSKDWSLFNPFPILRAVLPSGKSGRANNPARSQKGMAMQTELSLDSVKVVHNDLSDVDVEVVPIKSRAGAPELPAPKKSWEFVGEHLFGVEAT